MDVGKNFYASQIFSDQPEGRVIQIGWMRQGEFPEMPFNQQMSFPCELSLRSTPDGLRVYREPVNEIAGIRGDEILSEHVSGELAHEVSTRTFEMLCGVTGDGWSIEIGGQVLSTADGDLTWNGEACGACPDGALDLQILVDVASIEVFVNGGLVSKTSAYISDGESTAVRVTGEMDVSISRLNSVWS